MLYYLFDVIPKIQAFSKKLDDATILMNQHWVSVNEIESSKTVFIFRSNSQLLISENGRVERGKWEYIDSNCVIIDRQNESYLFKHGFLDDSVLALKVDGTETYALFVNETKYGKEVNNVVDVEKFLESKYLTKTYKDLGGNKREANSLNDQKLGSYKLIDGSELVFYASNSSQVGITEGCKVLLNGAKPKDGLYKSSDRRFEIVDGLLANDFFIVECEQSNGAIVEFDAHRTHGLAKGIEFGLITVLLQTVAIKLGFYITLLLETE
jgi:hypothetical protein